MQTLQEHLKKHLIDTAAHTVFVGKKTKNGTKTDEDAIIHAVEKKLPIDQIPEDELIPKKINIGGKDFKTDVVEIGKFKTNQCNALNDASVLALQTRVRPLSGGIQISSLSTWVEDNINNTFKFEVGTMGMVAVDNVDGSLVGVTNNHVIINDAFLVAERDPNGDVSSTVDNIYFVGFFNGKFIPTILQFDGVAGSVNFTRDFIGGPKRYVPIGENITNTVDGAIFGLTSAVTNTSSASQAELSNTYAMPFASTSEIDNLQVNNIQLYSVGRTTGPKGVNCPLVVQGYGATFIDYKKQGVPTKVIMSDVVFYQFLDGSNLPIYSGDSGSMVIGNFNGTYKIVGLAFAGDTDVDINNNPISTHGVFSRIDNVATELNISAWDGSVKNINPASINQQSKIYLNPNDTRTSVVYNGKTYFQAGLVNSSNPITNV